MKRIMHSVRLATMDKSLDKPHQILSAPTKSPDKYSAAQKMVDFLLRLKQKKDAKIAR